MSAADDNPYNRKTREILDSFADIELSVREENIIFPEGNVLRNLSEYFTDELPKNPYAEDQCDMRCVSLEPNGDVLGGNVYRNDILKIIRDYIPQRRKMTNQEILKIAMAQSAVDLSADASDFEKGENVVVTSRVSDGARRYLKFSFSC